MSEVTFRFSPDVLKRLGEELNPHIDQGILELAKNAYDADATHCTIELSSKDRKIHTVEVSDDGCGMTDEEIVHGWLLIGSSSKSTVERTKRYHRAPVGSKGLGRLAALRMGTVVRLISRPESAPQKQYELNIDWSTFDRSETIEEVILNLKTAARTPGTTTGTSITISRLREDISKSDITRLARGLLMLAEPFESKAGFKAILKAPEYEELELQVQKKYFQFADYHLLGRIDDSGFGHAKVFDPNGKVLYEAQHDGIRKKQKSVAYTAPRLSFDLWVFVLDKLSFSASEIPQKDLKNWLSEFGGVHVYVDGIRVSPYGNPGDDWIGMNLLRSRTQELTPSTNTSIGRVLIYEGQHLLSQKTDRSGLVENDAFKDTQQFALECLKWLQAERRKMVDAQNAVKKQETARFTGTTKMRIQQIADSLSPSKKATLRKQFATYEHLRNKEIDTLKRDLQLYRTLSTIGITFARFSHDIEHPLEVIKRYTDSITKRIKEEVNDNTFSTKFEKPVISIKKQLEYLSAFSVLGLSQAENDKRRPTRVDLNVVVIETFHNFKPIFAEHKIKTFLEISDRNPYLRTHRAAIESILINLIVNSIKAFTNVVSIDRQIKARLEIEGTFGVIEILDNGHGIEDDVYSNMWTAGYSSYSGGTGFGLTIIRDTLIDLGGSVDVLQYGELGGAQFVIRLPILNGDK